MKMNNLMPKTIGFTGLAVLLISWIQWFFLYYDKSNLFLGTIGGVCFLGFAYIHWWMRKKNEEDNKRDKRIDSIIKFYTKEEWKK